MWAEVLAEDGLIEKDSEDNLGGAVDDTADLAKLTGNPIG